MPKRKTIWLTTNSLDATGDNYPYSKGLEKKRASIWFGAPKDWCRDGVALYECDSCNANWKIIIYAGEAINHWIKLPGGTVKCSNCHKVFIEPDCFFISKSYRHECDCWGTYRP